MCNHIEKSKFRWENWLFFAERALDQFFAKNNSYSRRIAAQESDYADWKLQGFQYLEKVKF